jgi:hypothetical protein
MMEVLPDVAERVIERTTEYLRALELEKVRALDAYLLAAMGFSL